LVVLGGCGAVATSYAISWLVAGCFTEDFDKPDLVEAKALLDEIAW